MTTKAAWPIIRAGDALRSGSVWVAEYNGVHFYSYIWRTFAPELAITGKIVYKINVKVLDKANSTS